jgi:hypothetical protein
MYLPECNLPLFTLWGIPRITLDPAYLRDNIYCGIPLVPFGSEPTKMPRYTTAIGAIYRRTLHHGGADLSRALIPVLMYGPRKLTRGTLWSLGHGTINGEIVFPPFCLGCFLRTDRPSVYHFLALTVQIIRSVAVCTDAVKHSVVLACRPA